MNKLKEIENKGTKTLYTPRLIIRKFEIEDANQMYNNWATDYQTCKLLSWNPHKNVDETKEQITKWIEEYSDNIYNWVVEIKETSEIIGQISVGTKNKRNYTCEIGYCYGSKYWNNGYATETLKEVIRFLINECNYNLVEASHIIENIASGKVMENSGMKKDGILRKRKINKITGQPTDLVVYSITKEELQTK